MVTKNIPGEDPVPPDKKTDNSAPQEAETPIKPLQPPPKVERILSQAEIDELIKSLGVN